ncbi:anti-sigma-K factor RskA [Paenarthrobacter ilicis]|uniref:Regulator of SigK n=2 Tax=Paenarthrobacter ilicis TaxID=43665 RepID=A0ABX0TBY0_9MICC|nr:anti-sigma factor [Paenarthrobacter ilicis]MBM7793794.1 anti-sigma-K factor RskA [Paenarthrobacter ilicis]NII99973.1 anti-sigma-K factor RskA [Paenarthrobacter ilicis]
MSENTGGGFIRRMFANDIETDLAEGRVLELAELYALNAVSDEERALIDQFVLTAPEGPEFQKRVRQARETLAVGFALEEEPPAGLLGNIMDRINNDAAAAPPAAMPEATAVAPATDAPVVDELAAARAKREERRSGGARKWLVGVAAAAVIAVGGIGVGTYVSGQNDPVNQVLQAQDVQKQSADVPGGGTATISASSAKDSFVVLMNGVSPAPDGKVYQLWTLPKDGSAPVSQGTMDAEALSKPAVVKGLSTASSVAITVEPAGGSTAPTTAPVVVVALSA